VLPDTCTLLVIFIIIIIIIHNLSILFFFFFFFLVKVSQGKACNQSSVGTKWGGGNCSQALNGVTSGSYPANCIHTNKGDRNHFWEVDLGQETTVEKIVIYARGNV
jgi:hypothetical protein